MRALCSPWIDFRKELVLCSVCAQCVEVETGSSCPSCRRDIFSVDSRGLATQSRRVQWPRKFRAGNSTSETESGMAK
ncbi:hypothetical protein FA95DRAFT_1401365 [Auriscalpium vulgare]|uniref:Uncharacterized protein n=1 Tax=Auriscalpium vulgare TaxID=40419 RepID=A0ACB8RQW0_9AGAM|nr:hypothetical protein FA95DRAFT_1401365 [Auriscalpium vulgare]